MKNDVWKHFGFQGKDPRTDFRAAGYFGLVQLLYFSRNYPSQVFNSTAAACPWFFLALHSIRLSHLLIILFNLLEPSEMKKILPDLRKIKCPR